MERRTARRPPVNGTSPKTSSAGLALLLLANFSVLILFGSVYLVSTAGFVADQLVFRLLPGE